MTISNSDLDLTIARLVEESSEGTISAQHALDETVSLEDRGFSSLAFLTLVDKLELQFGVYVDLERDTAFLNSVRGISQYIRSAVE